MNKFPHLFVSSVLIFLGLIGNSYGQNPCGIAGSTLWLKSNLGTTVSSGRVSAWQSQIATPAISLSQPNTANQPLMHNGSGATNAAENRFNYNPYLLFDKNNNNKLFVNGEIDLGSTNIAMSAYMVVGSTIGVVAFEWINSTNGSLKLKGDGIYVMTPSGTGTGNNNEFRLGSMPTFQAHLPSIRGTCNGIIGRYNGFNKSTVVNNNPDINVGIAIGGNTHNSEYMSGGMGEFIVFNTTLSAADNLKVESYLAIKYGITLGDFFSLSNYVSSDGVIIWNGDGNYQGDVIGIGRDDVSLLNQKQSHYYDDNVRIYAGSLENTNQENTFSFTSDKSFVMIGSNQGVFKETATANTEMPSGPCARLEKEWKIVRTNNSDMFSIDIKPSTTAHSFFLDATKVRVLIDDDGVFTNATITDIPVSIVDGYVRISNIPLSLIPNNSSKYLTLAIVYDSLNVVAVGDTICEGGIATVSATCPNASIFTWSNGSNNNPLNIPGLPIGENQVVVTASSSNNVCIRSAKDTAIVLVIKEPNVVITPSDTSICSGNNVVLTASGGASYVWSNGSNEQQIEINVVSDNTISVTSSASGCDGSATATVKVLQNPDVEAVPIISPLCIGSSVMLTAVGANSYTWSTGETVNPLEFTVKSTQDIIVTGKNANGCSDTVKFSIVAIPCELVVPNIITPNNDGVNDKFVIKGIENFEKKELTIFNRWGRKVYYSSDYKNDWDGDNLGDGVYYFILNASFGDIKNNINGTITIFGKE